MKTRILSLLLLSAVTLGFTACSSDDPDTSYSVIEPGVTEKNDFDKWIEANYNKPYNIDFKYRYEDIEGDFDYYLVPARYEDAITMAHLIKHLCVETYNEVAGVDFTRQYFPKMFYTVGEWEYKNNGTFILGTAEGGLKIYLTGLNYLPTYLQNAGTLNHYYIKTIHHEFTHILNQTRTIPSDFQTITSTGYVSDMWNETPNWLPRGFITDYSQHSYIEDFAEVMSVYITNDSATWDKWMTQAGATGSGLIQQKLDIVREYMLSNFGIDLDELRDVIQRRQNEVMTGVVDLQDLSVY